jgi:hypothetical protein
MKQSELQENYVALLRETGRDGIENLIAWLEGTDFFTAPASTKYHSAFKGGLLLHSMLVYKAYTAMQPLLCPDSTASPAIMCLLHDICKTNVYETDTKNVKVDGQWQKVPYYRFDDKEPYGHGEKSVDIIRDFIELTKAEKYAIRFHMGGFGDNKEQMDFRNAANLYPEVTLLHIADLSATFINEKKRRKKNGCNYGTEQMV